MTAPSSIDPARFLDEQLAQASPDLLRQLLTTLINALMSADAGLTTTPASWIITFFAAAHYVVSGRAALYRGSTMRANCGSQTRSWMTASRRGAVARRLAASSGVAFASTQGTAMRMW